VFGYLGIWVNSARTMRHQPIDSKLFAGNRKRLTARLAANSLAVVNSNDIPPTNADGSLVMVPNSDLFYLTGIEQEESILVIAPNAQDEKLREILFLREPNEHLALWEGHKLTREEAHKISGIQEIKWLDDFPTFFRMLMCESETVYLNSNEHRRAAVDVQSRDARFIADCQQQFPLHRYERLARLLHELRPIKSKEEINLISKGCDITRKGFLRALKKTKPGLYEFEIEAEFAYEFVKNRAKFAYSPIVAAGENSCVLHYLENDKKLKKGDLLLLDVGSNYANYASDMTRTIPVSGKFTRRQKQVYNSVLRVMRAMCDAAVPGKLPKDWQRESEEMMTEELLKLGLITNRDVRKAKPRHLACKKYFPHGLGHPIGLDVHDVASVPSPFAEDWVITVEPGIYIPEEGFAVRLENDIVIRESGNVDLMAHIPIEADEIEARMR
ncbi:MAG: aminopeptidase P family protein, partial [Verrucomicrobiia bacterium]